MQTIRLLQRWRALKAGAVVAVPDGYGDALVRRRVAELVEPAAKPHTPGLPDKAPKGPAKRRKK